MATVRMNKRLARLFQYYQGKVSNVCPNCFHIMHSTYQYMGEDDIKMTLVCPECKLDLKAQCSPEGIQREYHYPYGSYSLMEITLRGDTADALLAFVKEHKEQVTFKEICLGVHFLRDVMPPDVMPFLRGLLESSPSRRFTDIANDYVALVGRLNKATT